MGFERIHPAIQFLYFAGVLASAVLFGLYHASYTHFSNRGTAFRSNPC